MKTQRDKRKQELGNLLIAIPAILLALFALLGALSTLSAPQSQPPNPVDLHREVRLAAKAGIDTIRDELSSVPPREAALWLAASSGEAPVLTGLEFGHAQVDVFVREIDGAGEYEATAVATFRDHTAVQKWTAPLVTR